MRPLDVENLLSASYDDETVGLAAGFTVPDSVIPFVLRWAKTSETED